MPIENRRFYETLGLAMRAGQVSLGESGALKAIASGKAAFVLVDAGASHNTKKEFRDACAYREIPLFETQADRLGQATGKPGRKSAAVTQGTLAEKLLLLVDRPD